MRVSLHFITFYFLINYANKIRKVIVFLFFYIYLFAFSAYSQTLIGTVKDSLNNPLQNVNIIAESAPNNEDFKFAITDYLGRYKLILKKKMKYKISVSYLGYTTEEYQTLVNFKKKEHHFILKQKGEVLDEIIINYKPKPIMVKKDTLTYLTDYFKDGTEFKMIDILEKLPGFEVTSNGKVTVQGKNVTRILVENKTFFGGSTKLAIENIPADALDKIEVIDNFNEVDFLKEVSDSSEMIINVKLKKEKKEFIFGDIETATEINYKPNFYSLHTSLFSYKQKSNLSYIGNINNIGKRSFSIDDLMRFQNIKSTFIRKKKHYGNISNLGRENVDLLKTKSQFSAINFSFEMSPKLQIESYGIFSRVSTSNLQESNIYYLYNNLSSLEKKTYKNNTNELLALGNLKLKYSPSTKTKLLYNGQFQFTSPKDNSILQTKINDQLKVFENKKNDLNKQVNQFLEWHKQFSSKNITTVVFNQNYEYKNVQKKWFSNTPFLNEYVFYQEDNKYNIYQVNNSVSNDMEILVKHYWILHDLHHLYFNLGNNLNTTNIKVSNKQYLSNGDQINIFNNDFKNQINYSLNNFYLGLEYKFKIGKLENKISLFANFYNLSSKQKNNYTIKTTLIEPKWNSEYKFNPSEIIKLEYDFSNNFPNANQLFEQYSIIDYNTIFKGNALLRNEKFHNTTLNYSKYNLYKGLVIYADASFNKKTQSIKNKNELIGINNLASPFIINTPETFIKISGMVEKQIHKFKISFRPSFKWSEYLQIINNTNSLNQRNSQYITLKIKTADKKLPKIGIRYSKSFSQVYGLINSSLTSDKVNLNTKANFLKHFYFTGNYEITSNKNQNNNRNNYQIANITLGYKKRNKPFSFELSIQNVLNNKIKTRNSFSYFRISNINTYILPRIVMFSVRRKI